MMNSNVHTHNTEKNKSSELISSIVVAIVVMITLAVIYWMPA